jgi:hypothetical protein
MDEINAWAAVRVDMSVERDCGLSRDVRMEQLGTYTGLILMKFGI